MTEPKSQPARALALREIKRAIKRAASKPKRGQPTLYSRKRADQICRLVAAGCTIAEAAKRLNLNPDTVYVWRLDHPEFSEAFTRAREMRAESWSERMAEMAFEGSRDYQGGKLDKEHVMRSKLAVETMQWQMARLNPRRWQERKHIDTSVQAEIASMTPEQRMALVDSMLKRLRIIAQPAIEEERRLEEQRAKKSRIIDVTPPEPATVAAPKEGAIGR